MLISREHFPLRCLNFGPQSVNGFVHRRSMPPPYGGVPLYLIERSGRSSSSFMVYTVFMQQRSGILIVNKPKGMTSHDVVDAVRKITGERTVGHAGTLDPMATGVLVVGVGREATKVLGSISKDTNKVYRATVRLGATSDTYDAEGRISENEEIRPLKKSDVQQALRKFTGTFQQVPPAYSAIKVGGVKAYDRARKGELFQLEPRTVTIHSIDLRKYQWPEVEFDVTCSSGTYVRSLAHDLGEALGVGAYLAALERTAVGSYSIRQARTLEELQSGWEGYLLPVPKSFS